MRAAGHIWYTGLLAGCTMPVGIAVSDDYSDYAPVGCAGYYSASAGIAEGAEAARLNAIADGFIAVGVRLYGQPEAQVREAARPFAEEFAATDLTDPILAEEHQQMLTECRAFGRLMPETRALVGPL